MSYTINPNAKNKWARNAENTMDLSLETDASSVYLDNGRTLEQELGEGSMVSNVVTVDSSVSKVINGTLNGAYESGVMYGSHWSSVSIQDKDSQWHYIHFEWVFILFLNKKKYLYFILNRYCATSQGSLQKCIKFTVLRTQYNKRFNLSTTVN